MREAHCILPRIRISRSLRNSLTPTDGELTATSSSTGGFVNSYSYNANGEQTGRTLSGTAYTLAYDYDSQLTSTSTGGSTQSSFAYDAEGRRVSRTNGGTTTKFYYGTGKILVEKQGSTTTAVYTYGNSLIRKDGEIPLFDGQGSERAVTNNSETEIGAINFDGFGNTVGSTGSSSSPYMYGATSGYRTEGDAGLSQVGARYYDAQVGRFITRDTELEEQPYLYCDHDPINFTDPDGHTPQFGIFYDVKGIGTKKEEQKGGASYTTGIDQLLKRLRGRKGGKKKGGEKKGGEKKGNPQKHPKNP